MYTKYFSQCRTAEEVKELYKKLVKKLHPDNGGNEEEFKKMSSDFRETFERLKNRHTAADGTEYEKATDETADAFMEIINKVVFFEGCKVELIGSWVWVSGNTYPYKDDLKALHFHFGGKKKAWYFHFGDFHKKSKTDFTMDDLRNKFKTTEFETHSKPALTGA